MLVFPESLEVLTVPQQMAISPAEMTHSVPITKIMASSPISKLIRVLTKVVREGLVRLLLVTKGELLLDRWCGHP